MSFEQRVFYSWKQRLHTLKANILFISCQHYSVTITLRAQLRVDETQMMSNSSLFHHLPHKISAVKLFSLSLQQCGWEVALVDFICRENNFLPCFLNALMHVGGKKCHKGHTKTNFPILNKLDDNFQNHVIVAMLLSQIAIESILTQTHTHTPIGPTCVIIVIHPIGGWCSWKVQHLQGLQHFRKSIKLSALLFNFCNPLIIVEHQSGLKKSLNLTTVQLSWHFAFVTAGQGEWLSATSLLVSEGKQNVQSQQMKKKGSHWDLNQISINYASSGLHKTFEEAGEVRLCLGVCWLK